jgi:GDPmannose 4,6-dehydratase
MWRMLQAEVPGDYVIATGRAYMVKVLRRWPFAAAGLDWRDHVAHDDRYERPAEVDCCRAMRRKHIEISVGRRQ